jgi:hypothetical protein
MSNPDDQAERLRVLQEQNATTLSKLVTMTSPPPGGRYANPRDGLIADAEKIARAPHAPHAGHHPDGPYGRNCGRTILNLPSATQSMPCLRWKLYQVFP